MSKPVWIVEEQSNPSTDYYLTPALFALGREAVRFSHFDRIPGSMPTGLALIFVRYIPSEWIRVVERFRSNISEMIFFMDDDVLDISASIGLPLRYRIKLARQSAARSAWIKKLGFKLWVSTPYLLEKYADWNPALVLPSPLESGAADTVFYHGSAAHEAEIRWLRPIIENVMENNEGARFEIIGGANVQKLYRGISGVTVVHPMKWAAYQKFLTGSGRAIGLAPVLESAFNKARSYTKFFDITRCGAVGIYSNESAFDSVVDHEVNGLLRKNEHGEWVDAILLLLEEPALRAKLARNAEHKLNQIRSSAQEHYKCLC